MEDYDVFNEMVNIKPIVMVVDDGIYEDFNKLIIKKYKNIEFMPLRFSYDLNNYSKEYIELTKNLFIFYYNSKNSFFNEMLRIKKHFKHYQRYPKFIYLPQKDVYKEINKTFNEKNYIRK